MKKKYNFIKKTILILSVITAFVVLSELLFIYNNRSVYFTEFYSRQAKSFANENNLEKSINSLVKAAKVKIRQNARQYPDLIPNNYQPNINLAEENTKLDETLESYLKGLDTEVLSEIGIAKTFYTMGLLAYRSGESNKVIPFFKTAVYLDPELSHYHVELANLYFKSGDEEKTKSTLEYCKKFFYPKSHCQQYIDNNLHQKQPAEVGFLQKAVEEHYKSS